MKLFKTAAIVVLLLAAGVTPGRAHDSAAIEREIRALAAQWVAAVAAKDVATIAALYAPDGLFMPPNAPALEGADAIGAAWQGLIDLPGLSMTFVPTRVVVSAKGDMAADIGTYALSFDGDGGRVEDKGKYVVVWRKIGGAWRVLSDIFNTNVAAQ
jgi:uncharacterized protein (TIGR02246 family)